MESLSLSTQQELLSASIHAALNMESSSESENDGEDEGEEIATGDLLISPTCISQLEDVPRKDYSVHHTTIPQPLRSTADIDIEMSSDLSPLVSSTITVGMFVTTSLLAMSTLAFDVPGYTFCVVWARKEAPPRGHNSRLFKRGCDGCR